MSDIPMVLSKCGKKGMMFENHKFLNDKNEKDSKATKIQMR